MAIISTLRSKQKTFIISVTLLLVFVLTPTVSVAANYEHEGYRNNNAHSANRERSNHHAKKHIKHLHNGHQNKYAYADRHYHVAPGHYRKNHHKHKKHYYKKPYYALNRHHHHADRYALQLGVHTGNLDIMVFE
ncbi:MAG: hypothetical protein OQK77_11380 [Psychromonas sp.]|nr:hypothetical protein [Psychromonas sp.]